jgi:arsenate reductase
MRAFADAFRFMRNRINAFTALPLTMLDGMSLKKSLQDIGALEGAAQKKS